LRGESGKKKKKEYCSRDSMGSGGGEGFISAKSCGGGCGDFNLERGQSLRGTDGRLQPGEGRVGIRGL